MEILAPACSSPAAPALPSRPGQAPQTAVFLPVTFAFSPCRFFARLTHRRDAHRGDDLQGDQGVGHHRHRPSSSARRWWATSPRAARRVPWTIQAGRGRRCLALLCPGADGRSWRRTRAWCHGRDPSGTVVITAAPMSSRAHGYAAPKLLPRGSPTQCSSAAAAVPLAGGAHRAGRWRTGEQLGRGDIL